MFTFEDPVGVKLAESAEGALTGRGCAVGAPESPVSPDFQLSLCGDVVGSVTGHQASFGFAFALGPPVAYRATVTVSNDAQRMTGVFNNGTADSGYPMTWLRVPDGAAWLERGPSTPEQLELEGTYDLRLVSVADRRGVEYVANKTYLLRYSRRTLSGDLGCFWWNEMSNADAGSPLQVGPVPATAPELPTRLSLDFDTTGFTEIEAVTASGNIYTFAVTRRAQ
jgi:hypothetical protein